MLTSFNKPVWYVFLFLLLRWQCRIQAPNRIPQPKLDETLYFHHWEWTFGGRKKKGWHCVLKLKPPIPHPNSQRSQPAKTGQNHPVFVPSISPTFTGFLSMSTHCWKCLFINCTAHGFCLFISIGRCIKVTQFNKIKSWLRSRPQWWFLQKEQGGNFSLDALLVF